MPAQLRTVMGSVIGLATGRQERGTLIVSSTTTATLHRVHNFNAGPSALPLSVLERIREELLDWGGSGMSVMEMSHRSPEFESINAAAEAGLRKHLAVPGDYAVIFLRRRLRDVYDEFKNQSQGPFNAQSNASFQVRPRRQK